jgi:manganese/zinc/iron transport system permease protein
MVGLAALFGALAAVSGAAISSTTARLSTGPTIVLCLSFIVIASLLLAPNRGLVWNWVRYQRNRRQLQVETVLSNLYALASQHANLEHGHSTAALRAMSLGSGGVAHTLQELDARGWVRQLDAETWALTSSGMTEAERIMQTRGS